MAELHYRCFKCGRDEKTPSAFYKSRSTVYDNHGYMPICKDCLNALYNNYEKMYNDIHKAIKRICMLFDLYYSDTVVACIDAKNFHFVDYLKKLNLVHFKGKDFTSTLEEDFDFYDEKDVMLQLEDSKNIVTNVFNVPKTVKAKWGTGFTDNEYIVLEEHYKSLKNANPNCDSNQEIFIIDLCFIKMQQVNALKNKATDDYIKLSDSYRKTFQQAGLKTTRDSAENENFTIGVTAETIEKYTPAEFYNDKSLFKDNDNIGDYIERFMLRPLKNLMFGTHDRDHEYYVKDEGEEDDFDEE